jgi:predicted phage terminase large subunit-like protein
VPQITLEGFQAQAIQSDFSSFLWQSFATLHGSAPFRCNWHLDALADYLQAVERGHIRRLIINMPPRYLKSLTVSVAWPAWLLAQNPASQIIVASYASALSIKHSLDCRQIMQSEWFQRYFPQTKLARGQNEKKLYRSTENGFRLAASVGGAITGFGGDVLIADDPISPHHADSKLFRVLTQRWFEHTFSSRLNDKKRGAIVIVMQRVHEEDLSGYLLRKGGWEHLTLPALAEDTRHFVPLAAHYRQVENDPLHPARESPQTLEQIKRELGSYAFAAQYLQQPVARSGGMISAQWLKRYVQAPEEGQVIQSWDTAIKTGKENDYSVCLTLRVTKAEIYLLKVWRARADYPDLRRRLMQEAEEMQPSAILLEDKASGQSLLQDLRRETMLPLIAVMPKLDKVTRVASVSAMIEAGQLRLPERAHWLAAFEEELLSFPHSRHDDQVDALSQALQWIQARNSGVGMSVRRI